MKLHIVFRSDVIPDVSVDNDAEVDEVVGVFSTPALAADAILRAVRDLDALDDEGDRDWIKTLDEDGHVVEAEMEYTRIRAERHDLDDAGWKP